jgi:hypothetical protein
VKRILTLLLLSLPLVAQERNPANYERYLIPVVAAEPLPGAYGSRWATTLYFRNDGDTPVDAFPLTPSCISSAFCFQFVRAFPAFPPKITAFEPLPRVAPVTTTAGLSGRFLYIERDRAEQLSMRAAVGDVSRTPPGSTELPIVPESAFFNTTRSILGVALLPATRVALRVYTADTRPGASITVRIHEMAPRLSNEGPFVEAPRLLAERVFTFAYDAAEDRCGFNGCPENVRYVPATVQLTDLAATFPELATMREQPYGVRVEIVPNTPELRYYPIVTAARDMDSFVSLYTVR